ncbi:MAG TPA: hypothetical protein ENJ45_04955, partial [Phaeodactylibacter sp.]|nr:hypothetical protein [Phaeodactylibacter sp.]
METEANKNGYASTKSIQHLQARLNEDRIVLAIDRLLDRIDVLEKTVEHLSALVEQGPGLTAMTIDMVDDTVNQAKDRGVDIDQRLKAALHLAEKLTAPEMVEKLETLISLANEAPGLTAMTVDMVDDTVKQAKDRGVDIDQRLKAALHLAEKLTAPEMVEKLETLISLANEAPGLTAMT